MPSLFQSKFINTCHSSCASGSLVVAGASSSSVRSLAEIAILPSFLLSKDACWSSCNAIVVGGASSSSVRSLATVAAVRRCFSLSKDVRWSSVVVRSCGHAIVVGGASSSSIHLLATICTRRCFSPLDDDRSSLLGSCSSSSSICSFARIAIVHCVSSSRDDRSVSRIVRHRLFAVRRRLGIVSRCLLSHVCRYSFVLGSHSLCVIVRPSLVCRC